MSVKLRNVTQAIQSIMSSLLLRLSLGVRQLVLGITGCRKTKQLKYRQ